MEFLLKTKGSFLFQEWVKLPTITTILFHMFAVIPLNKKKNTTKSKIKKYFMVQQSAKGFFKL